MNTLFVFSCGTHTFITDFFPYFGQFCVLLQQHNRQLIYLNTLYAKLYLIHPNHPCPGEAGQQERVCREVGADLGQHGQDQGVRPPHHACAS